MGADETAVNGGMQIPDATRSRMLEHKYIELLEKRIAALEALTANNTTNHVSWLIQAGLIQLNDTSLQLLI
jgi:hypothetical protein